MDDLAVHETMGAVLMERGLATQEQVTADRASLAAALGRDNTPVRPVPVKTAAPSATATPSSPATDKPDPNGIVDALGRPIIRPTIPTNAPLDQAAPVDPLAAAFDGPSSPDAYQFDAPAKDVPVNAEQEQQFRSFFHAEGVPVPIANQIGKLWNQAIASPPTHAQLQHGARTMADALARTWGADYEANLAIAQREVQRMEKAQPGIVAMLDNSGLGNSPWLAQTLVNLAMAKGRRA